MKYILIESRTYDTGLLIPLAKADLLDVITVVRVDGYGSDCKLLTKVDGVPVHVQMTIVDGSIIDPNEN